MVYKGSPNSEQVAPGDVLGGGEVIATNAGGAASTLTGAMLTTGILNRTGPGAGFTDTTDTAVNILAALSGNLGGAIVSPGTTWRFRYINTVAFAMTFAAGVGVVSGIGTLSVAASLTRDYLFTVLNTTPQVILNCATTNASAVVTFNLPPGMISFPIGPAPNAINITPGATVSGTGITAGTTVLGVTQGVGGVTGVTLSANATATNNPVALTFGPTIKIDSLGSMTA